MSIPSSDDRVDPRREQRLERAVATWILHTYRGDVDLAAIAFADVTRAAPTAAELASLTGWAVARLPRPWDPDDLGAIGRLLPLYTALPPHDGPTTTEVPDTMPDDWGAR